MKQTALNVWFAHWTSYYMEKIWQCMNAIAIADLLHLKSCNASCSSKAGNKGGETHAMPPITKSEMG